MEFSDSLWTLVIHYGLWCIIVDFGASLRAALFLVLLKVQSLHNAFDIKVSPGRGAGRPGEPETPGRDWSNRT